MGCQCVILNCCLITDLAGSTNLLFVSLNVTVFAVVWVTWILCVIYCCFYSKVLHIEQNKKQQNSEASIILKMFFRINLLVALQGKTHKKHMCVLTYNQIKQLLFSPQLFCGSLGKLYLLILGDQGANSQL